MTPMSHLRWRATASADSRTREGTFNHFVLSHFRSRRGVKPVEAVPLILEAWTRDHAVTWGKPRAYVQQRIYELGRRGILEIRELIP